MTRRNGRVLFIVTSTSEIGPGRRSTGYEFSEVAHPYLVFVAHGFDVDFASTQGGRPPEDGFDAEDEASVTFRNSPGFEWLNQSFCLADVDVEQYDAIFFPGGLGPMVDMVDNSVVKRVIAVASESDKVIGAVCHGPAALLNIKRSDGTNFLKGRHVAAFTSAEEVGHSEEDVPFMLDEALIGQGACHTHACLFERHVVVDRRLVTGQNPASAAGVASAMVDILTKLGWVTPDES